MSHYHTIGQAQAAIRELLREEEAAERPNQAMIAALKGSRTMLRRVEGQLRRRHQEAGR